MRALINQLVWAGCVAVACASSVAQVRTVAITFDDLPLAGASDPSGAAKVNEAILQALEKHRVPAIGFVIEKRAQVLGAAEAGRVLRAWVQQGHELGNHSFSHLDLNQLSIAQFQDEVLAGEKWFARLLAENGASPRYFRFPFNHTGDTKEKHDAVARFLSEHKYRVAVCTIDTSDYEFSRAYDIMLQRRDEPAAAELRTQYLAYTSAEIDYYAKLQEQVFGRETPHVMLLHVNPLNAEVLERILVLFEERGFRFVTLDAAQSDPAYKNADTFVTKYGPMWGYRWAAERRIKVNGRLEPEPPQWILDYGKLSQ